MLRFRSILSFAGISELLGEKLGHARTRKWTSVNLLRWVYVFCVSHFTRLGGALFLISFAFAGFVVVLGRHVPAHVPPLFILCLFGVNLIVGFVFRPRLEVTRLLPANVMVGQKALIRYVVWNRSRRNGWDVSLDMLPLPQGLSFPEGRAGVSVVPPGERLQLVSSVQARERGRYVLPVAFADSSFPLGLWRWGCVGRGERRLSVYPSFTMLREMDMSFGSRYQPGGVAFSSNVGGIKEFQSCREYRYGDDRRNIHWRSWARIGSPVVKEFREEYLCRTALILDTRRPRNDPGRYLNRPCKPFEAAVSLTAAIAEFLSKHEYVVEFFAAGPEIYRFEYGRSIAYFEDILDVLSAVETHPGEPVEQLLSEVASERSRLSNAVLVLLSWDPLRAELVRMLSEAGVFSRVIVVARDRSHQVSIDGDMTVVLANDVLEGRCVRL